MTLTVTDTADHHRPLTANRRDSLIVRDLRVKVPLPCLLSKLFEESKLEGD